MVQSYLGLSVILGIDRVDGEGKGSPADAPLMPKMAMMIMRATIGYVISMMGYGDNGGSP